MHDYQRWVIRPGVWEYVGDVGGVECRMMSKMEYLRYNGVLTNFVVAQKRE